jgi:hypothetical protein
MNVNVTFPKLGVKITPATSQEEIDRLCNAHPDVKKYFEKLTLTDHGKKGKGQQ